MSEPQGIKEESAIEVPLIDEPEPIRISGGFRIPRVGMGDRSGE